VNGALSDRFGRRARKLRVSLTRGCSLRCLYCGGGAVGSDELSAQELVRLVGLLANLGIEEIRLTGGEPLERPDLVEVLQGLSGIPLRRALTTNGQHLASRAGLLARTGFATVNVSLDSLREGTFRRLTGGGDLGRTLEGIAEARTQGLSVKLNCVALAGANDDEFGDLARYACGIGSELRFLELLPAGPARRASGSFLQSAEVRRRLESDVGPLVPISTPEGSTSQRFATPAGTPVGFISGVSHPFCESCTRLRLSADGVLYPCLFGECGLPLRGAQREEVEKRVHKALAAKPKTRVPETSRALGKIGG
jgi:cyclic pyranopterin phosphate synthase